MAWWTRRWLPRAIDAVADFSSFLESARETFEVLAADWTRDFAPIWGSDVTTTDLIDLFDKSVAGRSS